MHYCSRFTEEKCYKDDCKITVTNRNYNPEWDKTKVHFRLELKTVNPVMVGEIRPCLGPLNESLWVSSLEDVKKNTLEINYHQYIIQERLSKS